MMSRNIARVVIVLACLALLIPTALAAAGVLPLRLFIVRTGSMSPTIPANSAVIVRRGAYEVGQVITFQTAEGPITHRLMERRSDGSLVTKGDANATVDPGTISPASVIGGVVAAPPLLGAVLVYVKNPLGLASIVLGMVVVWLLSSMASSLVANRR